MTLVVEPIQAVFDMEFRHADEVECALGGFTAMQAAAHSIGASLSAFKVECEGKVLAVWGYAPTSILGNAAWVWLLSTPAVEQHAQMFAAASRTIMTALLEIYPMLIVNVDPNYTKALRWLRWLKFEESARDGPFIQMTIRRTV